MDGKQYGAQRGLNILTEAKEISDETKYPTCPDCDTRHMANGSFGVLVYDRCTQEDLLKRNIALSEAILEKLEFNQANGR
jgi:ribosomal protein L37AE/L43A